MKLNNIIFLLAFFCLSQHAFAQPTSSRPTKEMKKKIGDEQSNKKDAYTALEWYMKAYNSDNKDGNVIHKIAQTHMALRDYKNAAQWYQKLVDLNKDKDYPLSRYDHATALKMTGDYDNSIREFDAFIKSYPADGDRADYYKAMAKIQLDGAAWAKKNMEPTEELIIENVGPNVNSPSTEGGAFPMGRQEIIYTSLRADTLIVKEDEEYERAKIYMAKASDNGEWGAATEFQADVIQQEGFHVVQPMFNSTQTKFYFVRAQLVGNNLENSRIYVADYKDGTIGEPKLLDFNSSSYSCKDPSIVVWDEKEYLLFSSNMEGGKGGMDIWYAEINEDGTTKQPLNMENINTIGDDITPFFDERDNNLYFSSTGYPGYGGLDIFMSKRSSVGTMGVVNNMGAGFNTYVDDFHFILNKTDNDDCYGYILSNRPGTISLKSETCCDDIFSIIMPERCDITMTVNVVDQVTGEPLIGATVQVIDKATGKVVEEQTNREGNDYNFPLTMGNKYDIVAKKEGHADGVTPVDVTKEALTAKGFELIKPIDLTEEVKIKEQGLMVQTFNKKTNEPINGATVTIYDAATNEVVKTMTMADGNEFTFAVPRNKDYKVFAKIEGYIADSRVVSQKDLGMLQKMYLTPPPVFYNVYFDFNKSNIRKGAADTLDMVANTLNENPEMVVEVRGHTDALGSDQYNDNLSQKRANSAIKYLSDKGIKTDRLQPKGLGETQPAADNEKTDGTDNPEGRALNRRVEFKIVNGTLGSVAPPTPSNAASTAAAPAKEGDKKTTSVAFSKPVYKIGPIKSGAVQEYTVEFTNTGAHDFKIFHLEGGCSCTEPVDWTRGSVKPGEKGFIKFKFDSSLAEVSPSYDSSLNVYGNVSDDMVIYPIEANITQ